MAAAEVEDFAAVPVAVAAVEEVCGCAHPLGSSKNPLPRMAAKWWQKGKRFR